MRYRVNDWRTGFGNPLETDDLGEASEHLTRLVTHARLAGRGDEPGPYLYDYETRAYTYAPPATSRKTRKTKP